MSDFAVVYLKLSPRVAPIGMFLLWAAVAAVALLAIAHAVGVVLRARSAWILADVWMLVAVPLLLSFPARQMFFAGASSALGRGLLGFAALTVVALLVGGAVQVAVGRVNLRRGHRALSLALWGALLAGVGAFTGYTRWVLDVSPADLERIDSVLAAPRGDWIELLGPAHGRSGYEPAILLNVSSGRWRRVFSLFWFLADRRFSPDGRMAIWLVPTRFGISLFSGKRTDAEVEIHETKLGFSEYPQAVALSSEGRLAVVEAKQLSLSSGTSALLDPSADHLLVHNWKNRSLCLHDGRTGKLLATLAPADWADSRAGDFLSCGRIAVAEAVAGRARLRVFSRQGHEEQHAIELGPGRRVVLGGEPEAGELFVGVGPKPAGPRSETTLYLANFSRGEARKVADGLVPILGTSRSLGADPCALPEPASAGTKLFYAAGGALVLLDPETGQIRRIAGGKPKP